MPDGLPGETDPAGPPELPADDAVVHSDPTETDGLAELAAAKLAANVPDREPVPAALSLRLVAVVIDILGLGLLTLLSVIIVAIVVAVLRAFFTFTVRSDVLLGFWLVYTAFEFIGAGTFGKHFVDIRIANADATPATIGRRVVRWAVRNGPLILLVATLPLQFVEDNGWTSSALVPQTIEWTYTAAKIWLGMLVVSFLGILIPGGRTLHDRITGTAVFKASDVKRRQGHAFQPVLAGAPRPILPNQ